MCVCVCVGGGGCRNHDHVRIINFHYQRLQIISTLLQQLANITIVADDNIVTNIKII